MPRGAGKITSYKGTSVNEPQGIARGPDGALWFTNAGNNTIGRITTAGKATSYPGTGISGPYAIVAGPDGALWFTNYTGNSIGRITTTGKLTTFSGVSALAGPKGITAGPDGAMWFANWAGSSIGRITTTVTPQIGGFSPTSGQAGTTVTITGQNLPAPPGWRSTEPRVPSCLTPPPKSSRTCPPAPPPATSRSPRLQAPQATKPPSP